MKDRVVLSVIIPTHNRSRYAIKTIESVLSLGESVEVVVADTSDVDELSGLIQMLPQSNQVKHIRPGVGISVVDNFNAGLAEATGEYLVFIGDDDFVTEDILQVVAWASKEQVDAVKFTFPALYYWPDFSHARRGDEYAGTLRVTAFSGKVKKHDAQKAIFEAVQSFGDGPMNMPRAYLGMISRVLVLRVIEKYGALFGGVSPDVYSACLISSEANQCFLVDFPVIVPGASRASTSGQTAEGKHVGKLKENAHLGAFKELQWDKRIPEFYSVPTVWSYSLLKAVDQIKWNNLQVNYARLFVKCMFYHHQYRKQILIALRYHFQGKTGVRMLWQLPVALGKELFWLTGKAFARMRGLFFQENPAVTLESLEDVVQAKAECSAYIKQQSYVLAESLTGGSGR